MLIHQLKSKLQLLRLIRVDPHYDSCLTMDARLMVAAKLHPFEVVFVWNATTGRRFQTNVVGLFENTGVFAARSGIAWIRAGSDAGGRLRYVGRN